MRVVLGDGLTRANWLFMFKVCIYKSCMVKELRGER